jgi:CRISPR-associated protein Csx10
MKKYKLELFLESDTLVGSAEGYGSTIDTDIVFDEVGLPFIPSKRIKGILRNSAEDLRDMFNEAKIDILISTDDIFGWVGETNATKMFLSNLYPAEYELTKSNLKNSQVRMSKEDVLEYFTSIRRQTSVEKETRKVKEHSLRTSRVLKGGGSFSGEIEFDEKNENIMGLVCQNARRMGTKRNRGLGKISIKLTGDNDLPLNDRSIKFIEEAKCIF